MDFDFKTQVKDAGIPVTKEEIKQRFYKVADDNGINLVNRDQYSPVWALFVALCVEPVFWLIDLLISFIMPNAYLATANEAFTELKGAAYKTPRIQEKKAQGYIVFRRFAAGGDLTISAGTLIHSLPVGGVVYKLRVLADTIIENGSLEVAVLCEATEPGANHNLDKNFYVVLPQSIDGVDRVYNSDGWLSVLGRDKEDLEVYRGRLQDLFSELNRFHTDTVYKRLITESTGIKADNIHLDKTRPRGAGSADGLVLLDFGVVGDDVIAAANKHIRDNGNHGIGDDFLVRRFPEKNVELTPDVYLVKGLSDEERLVLLADIQIYIRAAFREVAGNEFAVAPSRVEPFSTFSFSKLSGELHREFPNLAYIKWNSEVIVMGKEIARLTRLEISPHVEG